MAPLTSTSAPPGAISFAAAIVCCVRLVYTHVQPDDRFFQDNLRPRVFQEILRPRDVHDNDERVVTARDIHNLRPALTFPRVQEKLSTEKVDCYKTMCTCFNNTADCSNNRGKLTFMPKLNYSRRIGVLLFTNNRLSHIPKGFFRNVSGVTTLHLQRNGLSLVSPGAFDDLPKLRSLYLDQNKLNYTTLLPVFSSARNLRRLALRQMGLGSIPWDYFHTKPTLPLERLYLCENPLKHLNFSTVKPLKKLRYLDVRSCRINYVTSDTMPNLRELRLQNNALYDFPTTCAAGNGSSLFPNLSLLDFSQNGFVSFIERVCLPRLRTLTMSSNNIKRIKADMFGGKRFPKLFQLNLGGIGGIKQIEKFAFRNPSLEVLGLVRCNIQFSDVSVSSFCFAGSPRLRQLQLSHNFMTGLSDRKFRELFEPIKTSLQKLYLGQCAIRSISRDTFAELRNLSGLYLHRNSLVDIPDGAFDSLNNLKILTLGLNQLRTVRESLFSSALQHQMTVLDLSGNPFQCDCDLLWFKSWYVASTSLFCHAYANYTCAATAANTTLTAMVLRPAVCFISREEYVLIIGWSAIFILLLVFTSAVFSYRWVIRLKLAFRGRGDALRRRLREEPLQYDVFVVCAEEDARWLDRQLTARLEAGLGLRLHLYERDGHPGKSMIRNTEDGVKASNKFMVVFSKGFAQDPRCQFQLDVCLHQTLDYDDALIVTCLGDVTPRNLTDTMVAVLNTTAYIRWGEGEEEGEGEGGTQRVFWDRLKLCLREALPPAP